MNKKKIRNVLLIAVSVVCILAVISAVAIKLNQPVVEVNVTTPYYYSSQQKREEKCGVHLKINVDPSAKRFVECVLQVLYDPDVLQQSLMSCPSPDVCKLCNDMILQEPGELLIKVCAGGGEMYTDPICFHVLSNEEINLDISLVSYTDEGGVRENAQLVVDMPVKVPVVKDLSVD